MLRDETKKALEKTIQTDKQRTIIMIEHPIKSYFEMNSSTVKLLTSKGFQGVYISFQRPYKNVTSLFKRDEIDIDKLLFIDAATVLSGEPQDENIHCTPLLSPSIELDELVKAIYTSLQKLDSKNKFIFIDSLTTITLYKPLSQIMKFSEFLVYTVQKVKDENIILIFNVAKDLAQKKFIRDVAFRVDQVISVGNNE